MGGDHGVSKLRRFLKVWLITASVLAILMLVGLNFASSDADGASFIQRLPWPVLWTFRAIASAFVGAFFAVWILEIIWTFRFKTIFPRDIYQIRMFLVIFGTLLGGLICFFHAKLRADRYISSDKGIQE
jgi:hypothetical protein